MNQPLKGVKVIDFTLFAAGPVASRLLADWGADVIHVEPLKGEGGRDFAPDLVTARWQMCNKNKRDLTLDMKNPEGIKVMHRLLADADVFVSSYRTKALRHLGLDYESLHPLFPGLVWAQVNGYGDYGPDADAPGFDLVAYWARGGGLVDWADSESDAILNAPFGFGDMQTAAILAGGICAALLQKQMTGVGEKVTTSLLASIIYAQSGMIQDIQDGVKRPLTRKCPARPLSNTYRSKDNKWFMLSVLIHEKSYNALVSELGRPDLVDDPRFSGQEQAYSEVGSRALVKILDEEFGKLTLAEIEAILKKLDIAYSVIRKTIDLISDEQAIANKYITEFTDTKGKTYKTAVGPIKFGSIDLLHDKMAPRLAENTVEVLLEKGFTREEIDGLLERGVVSQAQY